MAGKQVGELFVALGLDTKKFQDGMGAAESKMKQMGGTMTKVGGIMTAGITVPFVAGMAASVKAFGEQEVATNNLSAALQQTGSHSEALMGKLSGLAAEIQKTTTYGDEAMLSAMAYGHNLGIQADQLDEAAKAAVGLAAKYKIDLNSAMQLIGRASQGQTGMLARYGIVLEESLTPQEKFNKLLEIGAGSFGLAEAEAKTMEGKLAQLKNSWGDFLELIGGAVAPVMTSLIGIFSKGVAIFSAVPKPIQTIAIGFAAIAAAAGPLLIVAGSVMTHMTGLIKLWTMLRPILAVARLQFIATWAAALGPVGLVIAGVAAVAAGAVYLYKHWAPARKFFDALWGGIKTVFTAAWNWLKKWWDNSPMGMIIKGVKWVWSKITGDSEQGASKVAEITKEAAKDTAAIPTIVAQKPKSPIDAMAATAGVTAAAGGEPMMSSAAMPSGPPASEDTTRGLIAEAVKLVGLAQEQLDELKRLNKPVLQS